MKRDTLKIGIMAHAMLEEPSVYEKLAIVKQRMHDDQRKSKTKDRTKIKTARKQRRKQK